mgnify:CR=1 FL=1
MAQFSVNAQRFDPYKNFKFRVKWDGRYVAGISKVRGQFKDAEATLDLAENVADSKVSATIQTASFDSGDANRDGKVNPIPGHSLTSAALGATGSHLEEVPPWRS